MTPNTTRSLLIICGIGLAFAACVILFPAPTLISDEGEIYWTDVIRSRGGERAYVLLAQETRYLSEPDKHLAAHAFGAALYRVEGVPGLSVCDERYGYGCFHEFMGYAVSELGIDSVVALNEACFSILESRWLSCQHAIGHGIQAYFGYERDALSEALETCKKLPYYDPISGCFGGVFMEYNMRTMLGEDGSERPRTTIPGELCDSVEALYKKGCWYWIPQWWRAVVFSNDASGETFQGLGELCDASSLQAGLLEVCYRGIGLITPQASNYDPFRTRQLCLASSDRESRQLACLSNAANVISMALGFDMGERACDNLNAGMRSYCLAYARNEANLIHPLELSRPI